MSGYLHWRALFFVNIPIGLVGLWMVYRHLPDFREERIKPAGCGGVDPLRGSGIALLSYVLEIFGEHTLGTREILGLLAISLSLIAKLRTACDADAAFPLLRLSLFRIRTFRAAVKRRFFLPAWALVACLSFRRCSIKLAPAFTPIQSGLLIIIATSAGRHEHCKIPDAADF